MKTIKGLSALMLATAFIFSTAAFAAPGKAVVKQQAKTEKKAPVKKDDKATKKVDKKDGKKATKPASKKKGSGKKAAKKPVSSTKPAVKNTKPASK
jgi:hypothetical protein